MLYSAIKRKLTSLDSIAAFIVVDLIVAELDRMSSRRLERTPDDYNGTRRAKQLNEAKQ